ncbi:thioredoxin family protein [Ramlibacter albus]|uniref:Thioredoxin fold domain-containing protein n=1 Tax=Ramlibacter albus TaxID=2079448 RepID=A0A923M5W2_9BURK|nr:thioredoxin fold domain-containing protein [Ramlibacter albus]MBC5763389.1 thioredoxin fold domain-containing protein [Ramlibacter albus]
MKMSSRFALRGVVAACALVGCMGTAVPGFAAAPSSSGGIAWQVASSDPDVDKAFALARKSGKPVFLYWGAVWCPPCNQVKATLFSRADFVERSRAFVPVYVDGDKPGAQKVASRFKVSGYPTMILFKPDGTEVTRLPGEVDPERYLMALTTGLDAQVPVRELVKRASAGQVLTPEQWRLLAFYSWDTDEQQVLPSAELAKRLDELANAAPADQRLAKDRLALKAVVARAQEKSAPDSARVVDRKTVDRLLADSEATRELADLFIGYADKVVKHVAVSAEERKVVASKWDAALSRLVSAGNLSRGEQVDAVDSRVSMWKLVDATDKLSPERQQAAVKEVARLVAATTDRYERQAVVPSAAHVLAQAGLLDDADALLKAELPRAVAPYYHMLGLASNAKKRGDSQAALSWYEQAWRKSEGPATRVQWGANYVGQLVDLSPADSKRIADAAGAVLGEIKPDAFFGRSQRSLERMARKLDDWRTADASRKPVVDKLRAQLTKTCSSISQKNVARDSCDKVFAPAATAA